MSVLKPIMPLIAEAHGRIRKWFFMRRKCDDVGHITALQCPCFWDETLAMFKLGSEIWDNLIELRTPTQAEFDAWIESRRVVAPTGPAREVRTPTDRSKSV